MLRWFVYHRTMADGPNIARIAALIGDPARAEMLTGLMADRALTATELSSLAGVSKQTASSHLAKLLVQLRLGPAGEDRRLFRSEAGLHREVGLRQEDRVPIVLLVGHRRRA